MYRKATFQDWPAVHRLICEMEEKELPQAEFCQIFRAQTQDDRYYCLLWEQDGQVTGMLNLRFEGQLHHAERIAEILEFSVAAPCRNQGTGRALFAQACQIARQKGCAQLEVACNQLRTSTHRFYRREGMHEFHFKFSKRLLGQDFSENALGR